MRVKQKWKKHRLFGIASSAYIQNQNYFLSFLEKNENAILLDIGCNDGTFTLKCARRIGCNKVWGIEIDEELAEKAKKIGVHVKVHDANKPLPFKSNAFDVVISNQVIEHIWNTDGLLREIRRVLKDGGYCVISTANLASLHNVISLILGMQPISYHVSEVQVGNFLRGVETHGHIKVFTLPGIKDLFNYHGFRVEAVKGSGFYPFPDLISSFLSKLIPRYSVFLTLKARKE
jgi:SAM-dependent methyltransferase